ncbi:MAG: ParA family protein [Rhizobiaceae bacterium]
MINPDQIESTIQVEAAKAPTRILAIANQKGGVGKTTTAVNLGTALAAVGEKVLLIDLDPQGNASTGLGIDRKARSIGTYNVVIEGVEAKTAILPTTIPNLSVIPSSVDLSGAELELVDLPNREHRLGEAIRQITDAYTYILIDCPPALGLLTLNAFSAADAVLVPLQCEFYALEGLSHLVRTIERVKRAFNPRLEIQGLVLTMFDKRNSLCDLVASDVRQHFGDKVYQTVIPRNVRVSEAPSYGKPVLLYDFKCAGSQAYIHLASEVIRREQALRA